MVDKGWTKGGGGVEVASFLWEFYAGFRTCFRRCSMNGWKMFSGKEKKEKRTKIKHFFK
jgi:hypothetical protein